MIAQRIKQARELKGISKAELARRVCVSRASVSMWEDGKNVSSGNIITIAKVLEVAPEWLQYGVKDFTVSVDELADCLAYTRAMTNLNDWDLSDDQYAKVAAYLYQQQSKGVELSEIQLEHLVHQQQTRQQAI